METKVTQDDEIDLLDLLLTLAENWKLLIFGPLVVGLLAFGAACIVPKTYESNSSLQIERPNSSLTAPVVAGLAMSADVLHQIAPVAALDNGLTHEEIYKKLSKRITVTVGKQDKLLNISTHANTPEAAQKLNQALLDSLFPLSRPRGTEKGQLEQQLETEKKRLAESIKLEQETATNLASGKSLSESSSRLYGELLTANSNRQKTIMDIELRLAGLDNDDVMQKPTLPEQAIRPKKSLIAAGAVMAAALVLLLFVFVRQALKTSKESSPEQAEKLIRIRKALPW